MSYNLFPIPNCMLFNLEIVLIFPHLETEKYTHTL